MMRLLDVTVNIWYITFVIKTMVKTIGLFNLKNLV